MVLCYPIQFSKLIIIPSPDLPVTSATSLLQKSGSCAWLVELFRNSSWAAKFTHFAYFLKMSCLICQILPIKNLLNVLKIVSYLKSVFRPFWAQYEELCVKSKLVRKITQIWQGISENSKRNTIVSREIIQRRSYSA